jgi:hypothetical protein
MEGDVCVLVTQPCGGPINPDLLKEAECKAAVYDVLTGLSSLHAAGMVLSAIDFRLLS